MCVVSAVLITVFLGAPSNPGAPSDQPVITNYWRHVNAILKAEEARQQPPAQTSNVRYPRPLNFPFDSLKHLRAKDLYRAAKEGIRYARRMNRDKPAEEVDRLVQANIQTALEYYPMLAETDEDVYRLFYVIADLREDEVFRRFILERSVPGMVPESLFNTYLQDGVRWESKKIREILGAVLDAPSESVELTGLVMQVYFRLLYEECRRALEVDEGVVQYAAERGEALSPALLLETGDLELAPQTIAMLDKCRARTKTMVRILEHILDPKKRYAAPKRLLARESLERIYEQLPTAAHEHVKEILDAYPAEALRKS